MAELENNTEQQCFARHTKGCIALNFTAEELDTHLTCTYCKFRRTREQLLEKKSRFKQHGTLKGFNLYFDGKDIGYFKTIKDIDRWLVYYWETNINVETIPAYTEQSDYNVLFVTHDIRFIY